MKYLIALLLCLSFAASAGEIKELATGASVPTFTLKNHDGKEVSLAGVLKDHKYAVVMFISTECPVSNAYNDRMEKLSSRYAKQGVAFLGINANKAETVKDIAAHAKDKGFTFPVLKDERNVIADGFGAMATPEVYLIDQAGKLVYHGRIDDSRKIEGVKVSDLSNAIDAVLAGKPVPVAQTKAVGCSIKRVDD
jgi:peroxiredoxin